ncbi:MAG: pilus assembly protein TadG-related protein [Kiloniellales bacterium]
MAFPNWRTWLDVPRRFARDRRGGVFVLLSVLIIPLLAMVGLALDSSRAYLAKARLSQAVDAAALAGGRSFHETYRNDDVQRYFEINFSSDFMNIDLTPLSITFDDEEGTVTVAASASVPTTFMRLLNIDQVDISASAVVYGLTRGLELALVLDVTGSMNSGGKLAALKTAGASLLGILYGSRETVDNLWVSVVPFSGRVNFSPHSEWLTNPNGSWTGCGNLRSGASATNDDPPSVALWNKYTGTHCPARNVLPLTAEYSTVADFVQNLSANGRTRTDIGMVWGWRVLSPRWRGLWGNAELPLDYGTESMDKAVIIMTDGENTPESGEGTVAQANARLAQECEAMKDQGIIIYTITFQSPSSLDSLYRNCASQPSYFYKSPTNEDLEKVFKIIGAQLSQLRLAQ